jgi:hypothetical protein
MPNSLVNLPYNFNGLAEFLEAHLSVKLTQNTHRIPNFARLQVFPQPLENGWRAFPSARYSNSARHLGLDQDAAMGRLWAAPNTLINPIALQVRSGAVRIASSVLS